MVVQRGALATLVHLLALSGEEWTDDDERVWRDVFPPRRPVLDVPTGGLL